MREAVRSRLGDPSIRVREGAVDLIGSFVLGMGGSKDTASTSSSSSSSSSAKKKEKEEKEEEKGEEEEEEERKKKAAGPVFSAEVEYRYVSLVLSRLRHDPGLSVRRKAVDVLRKFLLRSPRHPARREICQVGLGP